MNFIGIQIGIIYVDRVRVFDLNIGVKDGLGFLAVQSIDKVSL